MIGSTCWDCYVALSAGWLSCGRHATKQQRLAADRALTALVFAPHPLLAMPRSK